ncbi:MAG: glycosyltransferase, partial [Alphaproteobacteria bacterium]
HGDYGGWYPPASQSRAELRLELGIRHDEVVLLAFGQIRGYKRLLELARAVVAAQSDHPEIRLLVAGAPTEVAVAADLADLAANSERVIVLSERVSDARVSDLYELADLAVLNYAEVFSSGALLLALTQGVAVVSLRSGAVEEVASWPAIAVADSTSALLDQAIELAKVLPAVRVDAARRAAAAADWTVTAEALLAAYRFDR